MKLQNRVALITGGTSGIGAAIAREFTKEGARVAIVGRNLSRGRALEDGFRVKFYQADLADADAPARVMEQLIADLSALDILVNNAGVIYRKTADETKLEEWEETFAVNARTPFLFSKLALPLLRARGGGVILNIASGSGIGASPRMAAYAASKGALVQLTRAMARDHSRENIRCIVMCPADVDTPMIDDEARQLGRDPADHRKLIAQNYPLGRIATPEEIARAAVFLVSDECTFQVGYPVVIDGGLRA